mgnify:CR=1 FL=1|jgi:mono/diheme cytochrome c family protein
MCRYLFLVLSVLAIAGCGGERDDTVVTPQAVTTEQPDHFLKFLNERSINDEVYTEAYSQAYYAAVDPNDERTTLDDWKAANDFHLCSPEDPDHTLVKVVFRDTKDLGYGRNMTACSHSDGRVAVFVNNYVVKVFPGDPSNYGPLNLDAAILENSEHLAGTNAIEFSPVDGSGSAQMAAKFYTFNPLGRRIISADLDGRGKKPMPQPCLLCHGARLMPLEEDGSVPDVSIYSAKMNQLEVDTFEYSAAYNGFRRSQQEEGLRQINSFVRDTFAQADSHCEANRTPACWYGDFAMEVADGRYGGAIDTPGTTYDESFVPAGWQESIDRPAGVSVLYSRVIQPHCIACHSLRGTYIGEVRAAADADTDGSAINFESYESFIGYSDLIVDYVYHRGVMPLSLRNYEKFWADRDGAPAILAGFLPGFDRYDDQGKVIVPGLPVSKPGGDRIVTTTSAVPLSAEASLYARDFLWEVIDTPPGASAAIASPESEVTSFDADMDGDYTVRLTTSNLRGDDAHDFVITVDNALNSLAKSQGDLRFDVDIAPLMRAPADGVNQVCTSCHDPGNATYQGIPVAYTSDADVYANVLTRIDLDEPENSILLRKPTRMQHGGGVVIDTDTADGWLVYNRFMNWIRAGAPCGTDATICAP